MAAALLLAALYAATLAPTVTFWDAGEFVAAIHVFGVPHPPGTPLYVALGHAWARALGALAGLGAAPAANLLSALCTAAAGGLLAALVARWTRRPLAGVCAALVAGTTSSVWLNATETEVYAASLLLAALGLWCAEQRSRAGDDAVGARWTVLLAYSFALAPALHLSALVAGPAAIALAATRPDGSLRRAEAAALVGALLVAAGVGSGARAAVVAGLALLAVLPVALVATRDERRWHVARLALGVLVVCAAGASALAILYVRARHDPAINQGNPSSWPRLLDVVWRRQYEPVPLVPRRAPLWLQLGNVLEYADWQWALGVYRGVEPHWLRTPVTLLFVALGALGALAHRRADPRSWRAVLLLLASASVGVALYLNLRLGPSFGVGILPEDAMHEARERDYFFALAFWTWGAWAGLGAFDLARRAGRPRLALAAAALPAVLNWRATDRRDLAEAPVARTFAAAALRSAPPGAVLLASGDNDTYPLWYLQEVEGVRRDVTVVTVPLLGAPWYRAELARRWKLLDERSPDSWRGEEATVRAVAAGARARGRPVAASLAVPAAMRAPAAGGAARWSLRGLVWVPAREGNEGGDGAAAWTSAEDSTVTARLAGELEPVVARVPPLSTDGAIAGMHELLGCPRLALDAARRTEGPAARADSASGLLDSRCNLR
ncbi:MAG: protein O-mannosyl-transferase family [Gemmatimonadaceae bacterium]